MVSLSIPFLKKRILLFFIVAILSIFSTVLIRGVVLAAVSDTEELV